MERKRDSIYVERKKGMHILASKYVSKVKNAGPNIPIVDLGCRQHYGIEIFRTFAPAVKMTSLRTILALVACADPQCEQMDAVTVFLYGDLEEDIFMEVPDGFTDPTRANMICRLQNLFMA